MSIRTILDECEQIAEFGGLKWPTRRIALAWLGADMRELTSKGDFDWAYTHLNPIVSTVSGQTAYGLPSNFGDNFAKGASIDGYDGLADGDKWACKIDDLTAEAYLDYLAPTQFHSSDGRRASGRPSAYTIHSSPAGTKELHLSPTPDANGTNLYYNILGVYKPTDWTFTEQSAAPPFAASNPILKYALLQRLAPSYHAQYQEALGLLMYDAARNRHNQFRPQQGRYGRNTYTLRRS